MIGLIRLAGGLAAVALAVFPSPPQPQPDYVRVLDEYASGDPDTALEAAALYDLHRIERFVRDIERDRSGFSTRQLGMAALLHFEAAARIPSEYGAVLVRAHLRGGVQAARRLHARGEHDMLGPLLVAGFQPLINDLPADVYHRLSQARTLLPDDGRLMLMAGATLENLALLLRDPRQRLGDSHPCSPAASHCLAEAEIVYRRVLERDPGNLEAQLRLARVRQMRGRPAGEAGLRQVHAEGTQPYATLAALFLAQAAAGEGRRTEALELYTSVTTPGGAYVAAVGAAAVHEKSDAIGPALDALVRALSVPPERRGEDLWLRYRTFRLQAAPSLREVRAALAQQ
jgi:hypothetical protein